ncbi:MULTISPECIES: protein kinase [unclassified Clostridium]|uniref:protein kinase n=1 Tax=Clostridium TaxID=1485 RepID=UPI001C8B8BA8|nr:MULTISPECIES: protein kinase [unclassified Clostridium]MBX9137295.1 protein kinase [Clostridium sp. K12(2020)]MBX9144106.1 protein kinase [Clostridium sp. K13]MDU2288731.1 protein kinase [Clostridium celatum]MDU4323983.1 protein kinase [Clostridium celatum]
MARTYAYSADFDKDIESLFKDAKLLGEGHNGIVYEVPGNRAIKIFTDKNVCKSEAEILYRVKKSKYFPKIYKSGDYYILRDMVNGERLDDYIQENGLSQQLIYNLYRLINEFKSLKFTKLDARCRDIYVDKNQRLKVIDPKQCYKRKVDYPRHLMKGLDGIDVLEEFLRGIYIIDKRRGAEWEEKINQYYAREY